MYSDIFGPGTLMLQGLIDFGGTICTWWITVPSLTPGNLISNTIDVCIKKKKKLLLNVKQIILIEKLFHLLSMLDDVQ